MNEFYRPVVSKVLQYLTSVFGGLLVAFETSILFFIPCFIITLLDVWAAYTLGRRVHKKHPDKSDGKFKSEYKYRILYTMIIALIGIILASYVDAHIIKDSDMAVRCILAVFFFYQVWSILENWSSENKNKIAKALQRIMVNKAERHLNVPLSDILLEEERKEDIDEKETTNNS